MIGKREPPRLGRLAPTLSEGHRSTFESERPRIAGAAALASPSNTGAVK
jgi:hypothetical protein